MVAVPVVGDLSWHFDTNLDPLIDSRQPVPLAVELPDRALAIEAGVAITWLSSLVGKCGR